jgi:hypothetical protein
MPRRLMQVVLAQLVFVCFAPLGLWSQNLLLNGSFNQAAAGVPAGTTVSYTDLCNAPGNSAALDWEVYVNGCANISTELVPSTLPGSKGYMMHVVVSGGSSGIGQSATFNETNTLSSAWVYINNGCVSIGTGDGGDTGVDEATCETGRWFHFIQVPNGYTPANEFIVYSLIPAYSTITGADFYVKNADVGVAP